MILSSTLLFVYGSLQSFSKHPMAFWLHKQSAFTGKAFFHGKLFDVGEYPAAISTQESLPHKVFGEIYKLSADFSWNTLDEYEGFEPSFPSGSLYIRKQIDVYLMNRDIKEVAWIYLYNKPISELIYIPSGDYYTYLQGKF